MHQIMENHKRLSTLTNFGTNFGQDAVASGSTRRLADAASLHASRVDISRRLSDINRSHLGSPSVLGQFEPVSQIMEIHKRLSTLTNFGQDAVASGLTRRLADAASLHASRVDISRRLSDINRSHLGSPSVLGQFESVSQIMENHKRLSTLTNFGQDAVTSGLTRRLADAASLHASQADISRRFSDINRSHLGSPSVLGQFASVSQIMENHSRLPSLIDFGMNFRQDVGTRSLTSRFADVASLHASQADIWRRFSDINRSHLGSPSVLGQLASLSQITVNHSHLPSIRDIRQGKVARNLAQAVGADFAKPIPVELGRPSAGKGKVISNSSDPPSALVPSSESDSYREESQRYVEHRTPAWSEFDFAAVSPYNIRELRTDITDAEYQLIQYLQQVPLSERIRYIQKMYFSCVAKVDSLFRSLLKHKGSAANFGRGVNRIVQLLRTGTLLEWLWEKIMWLIGFM